MPSLTYRMAKWYVESCGWSVMPLRPQSKQRLLKGTHFQQWLPCPHHLRAWFNEAHANNLAVVLGAISGNLVVIDFDEIGVFRVWVSSIPGASDVPMVKTARGVHVYVRLRTLPAGGEGSFQGMHFGQILAQGAITAPPSLHPTGHHYQWVNGDPRRIPLFSCLADVGIDPAESTAPQASVRPRPTVFQAAADIRAPLAYAQAAVAGEVRKIHDAGNGQRNNQLYRSALKLAKYMDILSSSQLEEALIQAAQAAGMTEAEDGIRPTTRSGFRHGVEHGILQAPLKT